MADREQARERSDAMAWALKGSLSSTLRKGLVFSYMPSAEPKVTGKQKAGGGGVLTLPGQLLPCISTSSIFPTHPPGQLWMVTEGEHPPGAEACTPTLLTGCAPLRDDVTHHRALTGCLSAPLSFPRGS